jgi:protein-arginine kinase activator protein McsA
MAEGTLRVTLVLAERKVTGLHVCVGCAHVLAASYAAGRDSAMVSSPSTWKGECDLCRIQTGISLVRARGV